MHQVLLQWNSKNAGLIVALRSILTFRNQYNVKIDKLVLLQNANFDEVQLAELDILKNTNSVVFDKYRKKFDGLEKARIETVYGQCLEIKEQNIKFHVKQERLHIKSVTDYQSIYNAVREYLKLLSKDIQLHINVSPGTPQMHTVWLMLNASGYLPLSTRIWSSQFDRERKTYPLNEVKFKPKTYLNEIFETTYRKKHPVVINPNDTVSEKRKEAEEYLDLFASISDVPILLIGERGVGKTTYIEEFIRKKYYSKMPFQVLPCGVFSEELMRSELFGYEKGAFTGANEQKQGVFHQFKNGGLLFLDEIHDLSKPLQRQLMQVLQSKEYIPIGSTKTEQTNFRLITASNLSFRDLQKHLDADFLDRIAQYIVTIPAIRDSREDISRYWKKTWEQVSNETVAPVSKKISTYLNENPLYGNFRDLQRLANYLFAFSKVKPKEEAIALAIEMCEKFYQNQLINEDGYFELDKTYNEIILKFNQDLAKWAIDTYGGRQEASEKLSMSRGWLSNAENGKGRKN